LKANSTLCAICENTFKNGTEAQCPEPDIDLKSCDRAIEKMWKWAHIIKRTVINVPLRRTQHVNAKEDACQTDNWEYQWCTDV
jgi:hypothetical protein